jgi:hypothetical protein
LPEKIVLSLQPIGSITLLEIHVLEILAAMSTALKCKRSRCEIYKKARNKKSNDKRGEERDDPFDDS